MPLAAFGADTSDASSSSDTSHSAAGVSAERVDAAIVACLTGLLEGWDVPDAASLYGSEMLDVRDGTCVWVAFDAYRAGLTAGASDFLSRMEAFTTEAYAGDDAGLDPYSPTTWGRTALVVGALGADPAAFGRKPDGTPANLLSDGLYNWAYTDDLGDQGSNAYIYALQALDACGAPVPDDAEYSRADMLEGLLACQAEDGSFALTAGSASGSVDLTGMALAALGAYADDPVVANAIEHAVEYLSEQQESTGGFAAEGEETSESCAMAIIGLAACGVDPIADARFVKEDGSALDALLSFQKADGTFAHTADDLGGKRVQDLPTEQALRALLALADRAAGGDGNVYTADVPLQVAGLSDAFGVVAADATGSSPDWGARFVSFGVGAAAALVLVALIWAIRKIRRRRAKKA